MLVKVRSPKRTFIHDWERIVAGSFNLRTPARWPRGRWTSYFIGGAASRLGNEPPRVPWEILIMRSFLWELCTCELFQLPADSGKHVCKRDPLHVLRHPFGSPGVVGGLAGCGRFRVAAFFRNEFMSRIPDPEVRKVSRLSTRVERRFVDIPDARLSLDRGAWMPQDIARISFGLFFA